MKKKKYERAETVAYDPGRQRRDGIDISVKLTPAIHGKALAIKRMTGAQGLKEVFLAALDKHVETLRLLMEDYRIFAAPAEFSDENTVPMTPECRSVDAAEVDESDVITEMRFGFEVAELKLIAEIQEMLALGSTDISTPVTQAVMAYYWMLDKQAKGYPSIHAVKEAPPRCAELVFDRATLLIEGG
jgi:hypothetical protein